MSTPPALMELSLGGGGQSSIMAFMARDGAFDHVPECAIFAGRPTGSGTNVRGAVGCARKGLMARWVEKARGAVLIHDEMGRNQSLCNRVHHA